MLLSDCLAVQSDVVVMNILSHLWWWHVTVTCGYSNTEHSQAAARNIHNPLMHVDTAVVCITNCCNIM